MMAEQMEGALCGVDVRRVGKMRRGGVRVCVRVVLLT